MTKRPDELKIRVPLSPMQRLGHKLRDGKYRAKLAGVPADHITAEDAAFLVSQTSCYYCHTEIPPGEIWTLEHKIPLRHPGTPGHVLSNLAKSCQVCNELKHLLTHEEFLAKLPELRVST